MSNWLWLRRSAQASGGTGGTYGTEAYTYNASGNLTSKAGVTQWHSDTLHKHAVTHVSGVQKFWYDAKVHSRPSKL